MERANICNFSAARKRQFGQGMTEYIVIVALVAVGAIGVYNWFGKTVRHQTTAVACGLAGDATCSTNESKNAGTTANNAAAQADAAQGLQDFGKNTKNQ
jgi:Flp pilus assembly pilin Flp